MLVVVMLVAMTRLGCQWNRQPVAALLLPVAEAWVIRLDSA